MWRFLLVGVILLSACTKYQVLETGYYDPNVDSTITKEAKVSYINRLYITLLGFKPDSNQQADALAQLNSDPSNVNVRKVLIENLMNDDAYYNKVWEDARSELLEGADTASIRNEYDQAVYNYQNTSGHSQEYWKDQVDRLRTLLNIPDELKSGLINMQELHSRAVNNPIYDDINMGTENFVVSVFQNFFFRYPTIAELNQGKRMVDGRQGVLFLQGGSSKSDFLQIIFTSTAYFEGQIVNLHKRYLFREPQSLELSTFTQAYQQHNDYQRIQTEILASDDYFFL